MNKKEKLQAKINKLQAELHTIEEKEWWSARPHIAEFECDYNSEFNDDGGYSNYFEACGIILNHEWIKYNGVEWQTFCDHLDLPLYPDEDELGDNWEYYLRGIKEIDSRNVDYCDTDYPDFVKHAEKRMRNPNYAS